MIRQRIPLATRYAVLVRQCDPQIVADIERQGTLKQRYARVLSFARCRMTGERLIEQGCQFDHVIPVAFGGTNDADNLQAVTPRAHRRKTDSDIARIAHVNRIIGKRNKTFNVNRARIASRNTLGGDEYRKRKEWKTEMERQNAK